MSREITEYFHTKQHYPIGAITFYIYFLSIFLIFNIARGDSEAQLKNTILAESAAPPLLPKYLNNSIPLQTLSQTPTNTPTTSPTPTSTSTPTSTITELISNTATPTQRNTGTPAPISSPHTFIPIIAKNWVIEPVEVEVNKHLICSSLDEPIPIPDNDPRGIEDQITIDIEGLLADIEIYLNVDHTWIGDLVITIEHIDSGNNALLINRPGVPQTQFGCGLDHIRTILDDQASQPAETKCLGYPAAIAGIFKPDDLLSKFMGIPVSGIWQLSLSDNYETDAGQLNNWCLNLSMSNQLPSPTPTQPPKTLPENARIYGINGEDQALPLDCESRSAVDLASYYGVMINEFEFLYSLPISDNPDTGFVGDVNGIWGQIPPNDYGVHAEPVAALLRDYGLRAAAKKSLSWDDIRHEISSSRPLIAWVIGSVINGAPSYYTSKSDQDTTIVAKYEHTVIVIGYTPDSVIILDGDEIYERTLDRFLDSWSVLNNMAVYVQPPEDE